MLNLTWPNHGHRMWRPTKCSNVNQSNSMLICSRLPSVKNCVNWPAMLDDFAEKEWDLPENSLETVPFNCIEVILRCSLTFALFIDWKISRLCQSFEGEKISEMIFADWAETTDNHLDSNLLMTLEKVKTLNQWNAMINQILFRRSFDTKEDLVMSIKSYINSGLLSKRWHFWNDFEHLETLLNYDLIEIVTFVGNFCQHKKSCLVWRKIIEAKLLLTMTLDFFIWTKEFQCPKRTDDFKICKWITDILLKMTEVDCIINHCQIFQ